MVQSNSQEIIKDDYGKLDLTLAPSCLTTQYCEVATFGVKKYKRNSWKNAVVTDVSRFYAAMLRHQNAELSGQFLDKESNLPHGWHALWNRTAVNYFVEKFGYKEVMKHIGDIDD